MHRQFNRYPLGMRNWIAKSNSNRGPYICLRAKTHGKGRNTPGVKLYMKRNIVIHKKIKPMFTKKEKLIILTIQKMFRH